MLRQSIILRGPIILRGLGSRARCAFKEVVLKLTSKDKKESGKQSEAEDSRKTKQILQKEAHYLV